METQLMEIMLWSGVVAILLLWIPSPTLARLGHISFPSLGGLSPLAPNWITTYSVMISLVGLNIYQSSPVLGFVIVVAGSILDRLDGKMAVALRQSLSPPSQWTVGLMGHLFANITDSNHESTNKKISRCSCWLHRWWAEFNFPGGTDLGKVYDPFGDKVKSMSIFTYLALEGMVNPWLVGILLIPELAGTIIRRPFDYLERHTHTSKATAFGKYKVLVQWVTIILAVPYHQHWIDPIHWAHGMDHGLNWLLGFVILLAVASVASRFKWVKRQKEVKELMDTLAKTTDHEL